LALSRAQHLAQMVQETATQHSSSILTSIPLHIDQHVAVFRNSLTAEVKALPYLGLADRFIDVIMYSGNVGFLHYYREKNDGQLSSAMLSKCAEGCKRFFEYLLAIPSVQFIAFTSVQWSVLIQAVVILSRLSFPVPTCPGWDPQIARETAPLMMYLDCLCYRLGSLSSEPLCSIEPPKNPDAPLIFKMVLESVKKNMETRLGMTIPGSSLLLHTEPDNSPGSTVDDIATVLSYCPMLDPALVGFLESWPGSKHDVSPYGVQKPAPSREERSNQIPVYHDLWATMTMSWAD